MKRLVPPLLIGLALLLMISYLQTDPGYRRAVAERAAAQAAEEWADAHAAQARAAAAAAQAPARAAILTATFMAAAVIAIAAAAALAAALSLAAFRRAVLIHPDRHTGLYPALPATLVYQTLNETGAQVLAAAAARTPLRAPTAGRILSTIFNQPAPRPAITVLDQPTPEPTPQLPSTAVIYAAARLTRPALPIGAGPNGPVNLPLKNLGNVLIAGLPGSGKSNLLASIVWAMGAWASAQYVQVAMIDTKRVDFGRLPPDLRLLWRPVAVDIPEGRQLIADALAECNRRFDAIATGAGILPYLIIIVDELADWTGDRQFTDAALEIGRKGRAAGVSLILATQMARADAIDPRLRAIAGASIAMRLRSAADSRMVIGQPGAELLDPAIPGRCLVSRGDITPAQAYYAGLDGGRPYCEFYRRLDALPHRTPAEPVVTTVVDAVATPVGDDPTAATAPIHPQQLQPLRLDRGRAPGPAEIAYIRHRRHQGASLTSICMDLWGYKDGVVWSHLTAALSEP